MITPGRLATTKSSALVLYDALHGGTPNRHGSVRPARDDRQRHQEADKLGHPEVRTRLGRPGVRVHPAGCPRGGPWDRHDGDRTRQPTGCLFDQMAERIAYLERQVEEERVARRRAYTLLARLVDRVPELETPRDVRRANAGQGTGETQAPDRSYPIGARSKAPIEPVL